MRPTIRDAERALRNLGLSRREAMTVLSCGWKAIEDDNQEPRHWWQLKKKRVTCDR